MFGRKRSNKANFRTQKVQVEAADGGRMIRGANEVRRHGADSVDLGIQGSPDPHYRTTPKPRWNLWRPTESGHSYEPSRRMNVLNPPPQPTPRRFIWRSESIGQPSPQFDRGMRPAVEPPPLPQEQQESGIGALASAIVQSLQSQNKQTEKFLARQSKASELPLFTGSPLDWPLFAHHFRQSTEDCGFSTAQNMTRLGKALRREARKTMRSLLIVPTNTDAVMESYIIGALVEIARRTPTPNESKLSTFLDY